MPVQPGPLMSGLVNGHELLAITHDARVRVSAPTVCLFAQPGTLSRRGTAGAVRLFSREHCDDGDPFYLVRRPSRTNASYRSPEEH
jgi:hypothetical protein